uniref:lipase member I isoform X4 n=1 Tax=Myodes glareolus TaxID=447135 RepID=UPI0020219191|nr:lipase member I isoform X4 [Myodes glareolus]
MRIYIFLCLMCWIRFGYLNLPSKLYGGYKNLETNKKCLEFSRLNAMNSVKDLFIPKLKISLMMYSRNNSNCAEPLFGSNNSLNARFNLSKKTVWIIHGFRPLGSTPAWLSKFTETFLKQEDVNLIVVDWNHGATTFLYSRAVKNTRMVAASLSVSIQNLLNHGASLDNFHFVGMSLGAHISGFVGKLFHGQLGRITGLDPAGPNFSRKPSTSRLDYTDAKFVDVIHTDSNGLGIVEPLGHIDFYPNGGKQQPGCPTNLFSGVNYIKCDHQRAVYLFLASFETNCSFISFPCSSYEDYTNGLCVDCGTLSKDSCPRLGNQAKLWKEGFKKRMESWPSRTIAFLDTSSKNPFCGRANHLIIFKNSRSLLSSKQMLCTFHAFISHTCSPQIPTVPHANTYSRVSC